MLVRRPSQSVHWAVGGMGGCSAERATDAQAADCSVMLEKGCVRERPTYSNKGERVIKRRDKILTYKHLARSLD
jgi:hypothetical protein